MLTWAGMPHIHSKLRIGLHLQTATIFNPHCNTKIQCILLNVEYHDFHVTWRFCTGRKTVRLSNCLLWNAHFTQFSSLINIYVLYIKWKLKISRFWKYMSRSTEMSFYPPKSRSSDITPKIWDILNLWIKMLRGLKITHLE